MKILEIILPNPYQVGIFLMLLGLILLAGNRIYNGIQERNRMINEMIIRDKKRNYDRFVQVSNFEPDFEMFCLLNDEMYTLLFNVACRGYIERLEFESIYDRLFGGINYNKKSFMAFYPNWLSVKKSFKTERINSQVFFEMFFKTSKTQ